MLSELRDRIASYLLSHRVGTICTSGTAGAWAMPARYRPLPAKVGGRALDVEFLLPRWADVVYHLEQEPRVLMIVLDFQEIGLRWLEYRGSARPSDSPDWRRLLPEGTSAGRPEELYVAMRVTPERIDLVDESQGWGARETLEV